ncbi:hypothetical protein TNCV_1151411 [Trichonephila clavipes]|nr:hypothetical protein TNCV_1151411 [Trichonephila clavipes]
MSIYGPDSTKMIPRQASSAMLSGQRHSCCWYPCTQLYFMQSVEHYLGNLRSTSSSRNPGRISCTVEKDGDRFNSCQVIYSQFGLAIHQNDHQARRTFVEWAQNEIAVVPDFHKRNLFNKEAHFWLNGYVNKQNCRIWSEANPQVYVETPLHQEKLTVWCALWAGGIIGPYFFKNDEGHNVTVNGDQYSHDY